MGKDFKDGLGLLGEVVLGWGWLLFGVLAPGGRGDGPKRHRLETDIPMRRAGAEADLASTIVFLCSEEAIGSVGSRSMLMGAGFFALNDLSCSPNPPCESPRESR